MSRASLQEACNGLEHYIGKVKLPEPDESDVEGVRRLLISTEMVRTKAARPGR